MGCAASVPSTADAGVETGSANKAKEDDNKAKGEGKVAAQVLKMRAVSAGERRSCVSSGAQREDADTDLIKAKPSAAIKEEDAKQKSRSRKSRARRLSYVDHRQEAKSAESGQRKTGEDMSEASNLPTCDNQRSFASWSMPWEDTFYSVCL